MASLFVIQGADQGKRFEFKSGPMALGRDNSNPIRLHDTEVSRRHAELRLDRRVIGSSTWARPTGRSSTDKPVDQTAFNSGDRVQLGQTVMLFHEGTEPARRDLTARVDMLAKSSPDDRSAILRSIPSDEGSRVCKAPDAAGGWLRERLMNLSVMYRATQAISNVLDIDALSPQILELVFESIGADRGAILLKDETGQLVPKAVRWRAAAEPDERMTISRTIVDHVLEKGEGVITTDAPTDKRFSPAQSIVDLPDPRGDLRADPGAAHHPGRPLFRHPGQLARPVASRRQARPARPVQPGPPDADGRHRPPGRPGDREYDLLQRQDPGRAACRRRPDDRHAFASHQEHPPGHPRRQLPDRHGPERQGRIHRPPRLDDRREEPDQDLQPRHGHALVLEGPRAGPRAGRSERDRRRRRRADAVPRRRAGREANLATLRGPPAL